MGTPRLLSEKFVAALYKGTGVRHKAARGASERTRDPIDRGIIYG
jgi:hypothetical protein